jgi:hypothetical protein
MCVQDHFGRAEASEILHADRSFIVPTDGRIHIHTYIHTHTCMWVQDHFGRAEASEILHTDRSFIVPTDGSPIRGLIQDHIVAGVQICQLNRYYMCLCAVFAYL